MNEGARKKILITGASGLLGSNLALFFRDRYDVIGVTHAHPVAIEGVATLSCDLTVKRTVSTLFDETKPDIVIHCAALANVDQCEEETDLANLLNHHVSRHIIECLEHTSTKPIYISTDAVYEGVDGSYAETSPVKPRNYYGLSKYFGEQEFLRNPLSLVLRTNFFGWNITQKESLGEWIINALEQGRHITGFSDAIFSSLYTFDLADLIDHAVGADLKGVYNLASHTSLSKYEFACAIAKLLGLDTSLILEASVTKHAFRAPRGNNLSLDVTHFERSAGVVAPLLEDSVTRFIEDYKAGKKQEIRRYGATTHAQRYIPYGRQAIDQNDIDEVEATLRSPYLTQGPKVGEFEKGVAHITGSSYAVAVNSATSALHIACRAAGAQEGMEVITSPVTFVASANCALYCRATPVFADIDPRTYTIDPAEIAKKITAKTRAVIPVHLAGQSCDMEKIREVVQKAEKKYKTKIFIIEDASHSIGSFYKGKPVGSCLFADMAVFSFHPVKHITTGEGGMICTNDEQLAKSLYRLRSHGITSNASEFVYENQAFDITLSGEKIQNPWYYEQIDLGYNYRLTDMQAALGVSQLEKLDAFRKRRKEIIATYHTAFRDIASLVTPYESPDCDTNFHLYILLWDFAQIGKTRAEVMHLLRQEGIQTQVHYIPVHLQPYYQKNAGTHPGEYPNAENYYEQCLSLPLHPSMTDKDVERVIAAVRRLAV